MKTCAKLGISFWDYLGARLGAPDAADLPRQVEHSLATLVGQRVFGLALGCEDLVDNAMRICGYTFVEYRPGILLKLPITVTSLRLSPELRPAATKLSVEGLRELVALVGESEGACPSSPPKSGPTCQPPSAGRSPMSSPQSSGR